MRISTIGTTATAHSHYIAATISTTKIAAKTLPPHGYEGSQKQTPPPQPPLTAPQQEDQQTAIPQLQYITELSPEVKQGSEIVFMFQKTRSSVGWRRQQQFVCCCCAVTAAVAVAVAVAVVAVTTAAVTAVAVVAVVLLLLIIPVLSGVVRAVWITFQ